MTQILHLSRTQKFTAYGIASLALPTFLLLTDPTKVPLPILMLPFVWMFLLLFIAVYMGLGLTALPRLKKRILAAAVGGLPILLLILQSIGQLTIRDTLITVGLILGVGWYIKRIDLLH